MNDSLDRHLTKLRALLDDMESVLVTFSGGVDSALVVALAREQLGDDVVALTALSPTFPPEELQVARELTALLEVHHVEVDSHELEREGYARNDGDRCYFCKSELFELAQDRARQLDIPWVLDGTISDDLGGHRPGLVAARENTIRHPLVEAGFDKAMVREAARRMGLPVWSKPSFACLGSRFPVGTRVNAERLGQVQQVESSLRLLGLQQFRARWHELEGQPMVRIEVEPEAIEFLVRPDLRRSVVATCRDAGFRWVTLDLQGYQEGSLSHAIGGEPGPESEA